MALRSLNPVELATMTRFLRAYAKAQLRNADQVDDVVQEALAAALAARAPYDGRSTLRTWLVSILRHKIADHIRSAARARRRIPHDPWEEIDDRADPARIIASRQALAIVDRALERLPKRSAAAYVLCEIEGYGTREACERLGMSPGHLWVTLHRTRKAVRARLNLR